MTHRDIFGDFFRQRKLQNEKKGHNNTNQANLLTEKNREAILAEKKKKKKKKIVIIVNIQNVSLFTSSIHWFQSTKFDLIVYRHCFDHVLEYIDSDLAILSIFDCHYYDNQ